jgi:dienelactone hydrolase
MKKLAYLLLIVVGVHGCRSAPLAPLSKPCASPVRQTQTLASGPSGYIKFQSVTITAAEFQKGTKDGAPVAIHGYLRLPKQEGPVPAVVLFHGGAGIKSSRGWASHLPSIGVATFLVNSFSGRGVTRAPSERELSRAGQTCDAYRALELLVTHPRIDRQRIALMGFSRGGGQTILAALPEFRRANLPPGVDFAAYLAFYPSITPIAYLINRGVPNRPVRIFHGSLDNSESIWTVRRYVKRIRRKGADVQLFEFEGAHHSFDNPKLGRLYQTSRGFTVGYNSSAHREAMVKVEETLTAVFGLKR